jgi:hypothetical protein
MQGLDVYAILGYGVAGLGFLLAVLAYMLLRNEQHNPEPRPSMLRSIGFFMGFSVVLCVLGLIAQFFRPPISPTEVEDLNTRLEAMDAYADYLEKKAGAQEKTLTRYQERQEERRNVAKGFQTYSSSILQFIPNAEWKKNLQPLIDYIDKPNVVEEPLPTPARNRPESKNTRRGSASRNN